MLNDLNYEILAQIQNFVGSLVRLDFVHNNKDTTVILFLDDLDFYLFFKVQKICSLFIVFFANTNQKESS